jgi:hypothetical protein
MRWNLWLSPYSCYTDEELEELRNLLGQTSMHFAANVVSTKEQDKSAGYYNEKSHLSMALSGTH